MSEAPVVVIGAGVGGLVCAIDLAARGIEVTVLERAPAPGGKMRAVGIDGERIDAGPTVFTMRWVFDELFESAGASFDAAVALQPLDTLARHAWQADARLDLYGDLPRSVDAIGRFAGARDAQRYRDFCARAQRIYRVLEAPFLRASRPNPLSLLVRGGLRALPDMLRISPFATLGSALAQHFEDPRLRQLFGRYATYCGSSPFSAPATLMLVSHVEREGVWAVEGGMHALAEALRDTALRLGARFRFSTHADHIVVERQRVSGVIAVGGERFAASAVVFNGDAAALAGGLLGDEVAHGAVHGAAHAAAGALPPDRRSLSAVTWALRAQASGFGLARHNVFFGGDSRREFDELFAQGRLPNDPTVYVCAQDRTEPDAPDRDTPQRLLCLVNAPARADAGPIEEKELERCERRMFQRLAQCGLALKTLSPPCRTTPSDFARMFPGSAGALYGAASHGWMASFRRPGARTRTAGLYLAGGTTHPGPGVPMAALSGRLAASSLWQDRQGLRTTVRVSTRPSPPAATPGGISTR